jgi:hypothetical protein
MKLQDVVALIDDVPEKALQRGQVGVFSRLSLVTWKVGPTPRSRGSRNYVSNEPKVLWAGLRMAFSGTVAMVATTAG